MKFSFLFILLAVMMLACHSKQNDPAAKAPVFSLTIEKFDSAFFNIDTLHTARYIDGLRAAYPQFTTPFLTQILMLKSVYDTVSVKAFYRIYKPVYLEAQKVNAIHTAKPFLEEGFKRLHYYFPKYPLTHKLTLFVGPFEQFGNIITKDAVAVGLQMHLGAQSNWYATEQMQAIYPNYLRIRFQPTYIVVNSLENILNDMAPLNEQGNLMSQLIELGKRQYILKACLPSMQDSVLFGYTKNQWNNVNKDLSKIWDYVIAEKLIYTTNASNINPFLQEGDTNEIFGEAYPGNIGKFIGYKIVEKWMQQTAQTNISMENLMASSAQQIFEAAQFAP